MPKTFPVLYPSPVRRALACGVMAALAAMLAWSVVTQPLFTGTSRALMLGFAALIGWGGLELWRATGRGIILSDGAIEDTTGRVLVPIADIESVDRGVFAFKPSHGVVIKAKRRLGPGWCPGLYWRFGKRLGIGGMTPKAETKALGEALAMRVAQGR